jgi:rhodanese-related sulfurtransferase
MTVEELGPEALAAFLKDNPEAQVLDVREDFERELCSLPESIHIPMQQIPGRIEELSKDRPVVAYCHHGVRSLNVGYFLADQGFTRVLNLTGGIDAYAIAVDPETPRY